MHRGNLTHKLTLIHKQHLPDHIWFGPPVYIIILWNSYIASAIAFSGPWLSLSLEDGSIVMEAASSRGVEWRVMVSLVVTEDRFLYLS